MPRRPLNLVLCFGIGVISAVLLVQAADAQDTSESTISGLTPKQVVDTPDDATLLQKSSYIIGFNATSQLMIDLKRQGVDVDMEKFTSGVQKALQGEEIGMTQEEIRSVMMAFAKVVEKQQVEKMKVMAAKNRAEGDAYLAENAKKDTVNKLPSGVQYEVIEAGTGAQPDIKSRVKVHYHGTLPDGTVFDSTLKPQDGSQPSPAEFAVARVVPGFSQALQAMKVGDKWNIVIPGELAYGAAGRDEIGPNQTLCFEVQLLEVVE